MSKSAVKKISGIIFLLIFVLAAVFTFLIFVVRTIYATNNFFSIVGGIILSVTLWIIFRKRSSNTWLHIVALLLLFIPAIPVYFTHMSYTNPILRDVCLTLFIGICLLAMYRKEWISRICSLALLILLTFFANGGGFYGRYLTHGHEPIKEFKFEDYHLICYKYNDGSNYDWSGRRYLLNGILWNYVSVREKTIDDSCKVKLSINYDKKYYIDKGSDSRILNYNHCTNTID